MCSSWAEDNIDVTFYFNSSPNSKLNKGLDLHTSNTKYIKEDLKKDYISKKVKQVNLMQELKRNNINKIDFINIDAEGAEIEILKTFDFDRYRPIVFAVEIHGNNILSAINSEIAKILFKNNYRMVASTVITYFFALEEKIKKK